MLGKVPAWQRNIISSVLRAALFYIKTSLLLNFLYFLKLISYEGQIINNMFEFPTFFVVFLDYIVGQQIGRTALIVARCS